VVGDDQPDAGDGKAGRLGVVDLLPSGDNQERVPGARQLHRTAVAPVEDFFAEVDRVIKEVEQ
jgi:hypothetical protein